MLGKLFKLGNVWFAIYDFYEKMSSPTQYFWYRETLNISPDIGHTRIIQSPNRRISCSSMVNNSNEYLLKLMGEILYYSAGFSFGFV